MLPGSLSLRNKEGRSLNSGDPGLQSKYKDFFSYYSNSLSLSITRTRHDLSTVPEETLNLINKQLDPLSLTQEDILPPTV